MLPNATRTVRKSLFRHKESDFNPADMDAEQIDSHTIGEIALKIGYNDPHYFSFLFKKVNGCSPRDYRNKNQATDTGKRKTAKPSQAQKKS
jgi:AraC-like DNA-binding protein